MTVTAQAPDLLTAYPSRMGRYGLLTHEEEVRLFRVNCGGTRSALSKW